MFHILEETWMELQSSLVTVLDLSLDPQDTTVIILAYTLPSILVHMYFYIQIHAPTIHRFSCTVIIVIFHCRIL